MAFDPDAYLAGDFDPDKYLGSFDPDQYLAQEPNSFKEFIKNSAVGNIPMGIARGGNLALRGLDMAAAKAAGLFGQQEEADRIMRESDARSASIDQFAQENFGQGKAAELGQGLGTLPAMIAAPTAIPAAIGGLTELQRTLDVQGVDPQTAADVASRQAVANTVLGATPFAPFSRVAGATANVAAGGVADYLSQSKLKQQGYGQIAEDQFNPLDPTQRAIDALGGFAAPVGKPVKGQPKSDTVLQNLNKLDEVKQQQKLTQGEGTLYVGKDGDVTRDLPRKVEETTGELDLIRTELQNRLQDEATRTEGQDPQLSIYDENGNVIERPLNLDLRTERTPSDQLLWPAANAAPSRTDTPEFKEWFGNSQVKDESGQPLQVYHGTSKDVDFSKFNAPKSGIWFATKPDVASDYAVQNDSQSLKYNPETRKYESKNTASRVVPVYLKLENPKILTEWPDSIRKAENYKRAQGQYFDLLKQQGYDGVVFNGVYVVFNPNQVKSAFNKGTWNKNTDNISASTDTGLIGPKFTVDDIKTYPSANGRIYTTAQDIINWYKTKVAGDEEMLLVLPKVEEMLSYFGGKPGFDIELLRTTRTNYKKSPAHYSGRDNKIFIGKDGMDGRTAVHEIIHALTHKFVEVNPNHSAVKELKSLLQQLRKNPTLKDKYGMTDVHELLAEAFSSRSLKLALSRAKVEFLNGEIKSAWDVLVSALSDMWGLRSPQEKSALARIMEIADVAAKGYAADRIGIDLLYKDLHDQNKLPIQKERMAAQLSKQLGIPIEDVSVGAAKIQDADTVKADVVKTTTGVDYIPQDPKITPELIDKISKEKDGSSVWMFTPGANARAELANSTLVKTVYRLMNNAFKRSDKFSRDVVQPVEKTISKLLNQGEKGKILHQVLMRELANKSDYTADELRAAGVPDDVIMAHLEFRAMMQEALDKQNQILRDKGKKPVTAIDAYVSARWSGPWRASVKDSEGNIIFQVAEHSKGAAKNAIEYIKSRYKEAGLQFDDIKYREGFEKGDNIEASYLDMLELLDPDDSRVATLKSIYEDYVMGRTEDVASQEKHFKKKTGVGGYAGNRPWAKNDAKEMFVQQFMYAKNAAKWADAQKAMESAKLLLNDPTLQELQKNNIAYSKEYVKNQLGFGTTKVFEAIDNALAKTLRVSPTKLQEYMGAAKTFFYLSRLGLSMPFTIAQFLQPAITNPAGHAKLSAEGFKHNPVVSTWRSVYHGLAAAAYHYAPNKLQQSQAKEMLGTLGLEAAKYMEDNAVIDINPLSDIKRNLRPQAVKTIAAPFEFTIRHSEIIARSMAFMGYVSHLEQSGQFDTKTQKGRQALFEKAEEMTAFSMTDYRPQERALAFERGGLFGDAAATLHSYQINNLMQATKYLKMAKGGDPLPLFYFFGMQALAGGLTGLWFVEDMDDFLENLKKMLPHDAYMKVKDFSLKNVILDNFGTLGAYGLASTLSGTNIHTRMSAGSQIPVWPFESDSTLAGNVGNVFPFAGVGIDAATGVAGALSPSSTPQERMVSARQAAPMVAQGPMERFEPFTTRTDQGIISRSPTDPSKGKYMRTEQEQSLRDTGFTSTKEQKFKDKDFALSKIERGLQDRINTAGKKAKEFMVGGKPEQATEQILRYDELGGDIEALINSFPQAHVDRLTTEVYRRAKAAEGGSKPAILKLQRYLEQHGDSTNR